jgi:hypothetical protein
MKALEAEYLPRIKAAKELIAMTKVWLDELAQERTVAEPVMAKEPAKLTVVQGNIEQEDEVRELPRSPSEQWISARDLLPRARQAS